MLTEEERQRVDHAADALLKKEPTRDAAVSACDHHHRCCVSFRVLLVGVMVMVVVVVLEL